MGSPESPWALETRGRPLCYNNVRHDLLGDRPRLAGLPAPHAPHRRARGPLLDPLRGLLAPAHPGHSARHGPHPPAPASGDPPPRRNRPHPPRRPLPAGAGPRPGRTAPGRGLRGLGAAASAPPLVPVHPGRLHRSELLARPPAAPPLVVQDVFGEVFLPRDHAVEEDLVALVQSARDLRDVHVGRSKLLERVLDRRLGLARLPHVKMSSATYPTSGQVWTERWDSEITTTPLTPVGRKR